jgi:hypothetical protein
MPITYAYQWQRDADGDEIFGDISGETSDTYTEVSDDEGCNVRCLVTATNETFSTTAPSDSVIFGGTPAPFEYDSIATPVQIGGSLNQLGPGGDVIVGTTPFTAGGPEDNFFQSAFAGHFLQDASLEIDGDALYPLVTWVEPYWDADNSWWTWGGPYVAGYDPNTSAWVVIGTALETGLTSMNDFDPVGYIAEGGFENERITEYNAYYESFEVGQRFLPSHPRLAFDGTTLYAAYSVRKVVEIDGNVVDPRVPVLKYWDGTDWVLMYEGTAGANNTWIQGNYTYATFGDIALDANAADGGGLAWLAWQEAGPAGVDNTVDWITNWTCIQVALDGTVEISTTPISDSVSPGWGDNPTAAYQTQMVRDGGNVLYNVSNAIPDGQSSGFIYFWRPSDASPNPVDASNIPTETGLIPGTLGVGPLSRDVGETYGDGNNYLYAGNVISGPYDNFWSLAQVVMPTGGAPTEADTIDNPDEALTLNIQIPAAIEWDGTNVWVTNGNRGSLWIYMSNDHTLAYIFAYHFNCRSYAPGYYVDDGCEDPPCWVQGYNMQTIADFTPDSGDGASFNLRRKGPNLYVNGNTGPGNTDTLFWTAMMDDGTITAWSLAVGRVVPATSSTVSDITYDSATITVDYDFDPFANGDFQCYVEWGLTDSYGENDLLGTLSDPSGSIPLADDLTGLAINSVYHYRAYIVGPDGCYTYGPDETFETPLLTSTPFIAISFAN